MIMRRSWWLLTLIAVLATWSLVRWAPPVEAFPTYTCDPDVCNCSPAAASSGSTDSNCAQCHTDFNQGTYTSLADGQSYGNDLMDLHKAILASDCDTCHGSGRNWPVLLNSSAGGIGFDPIACVGCHGRVEDRDPTGCNDPANATGFCSVTKSTSCSTDPECPAGESCVLPCGDGAGLRQQHFNVNRTISTANGPVSTQICVTCHSDSDPANFTPAGEDTLPPHYFTPDPNHPKKPTDPCNPSPDFVEKMRGGNPPVPLGSLDGLNNDGDEDASGPLYDQFDPDCQADLCDGVVCDDGNICTDDACDPATGACEFTDNTEPCDDGLLCTINDACAGGVCVSGPPLPCNDANLCTADSCDPGTGQCVFTPIPPPLAVGSLNLPNATTVVWAASPNAAHWNSYRGTIPIGGLGTRLPGSPYDHACFESANAAGDGATLSTDLTDPAIGTAFYYDSTGENVCVEGPLGTDSSGVVRPNTAPCPTPP
jgi:hypothetical protein